MEKVKVGVLGSGDVGKTLARGFLKLGHPVKIGSREPEKLAEWVAAAGDGASSGTFEDAARFGDVIVIATRGNGTEHALQLAGAQNFRGKVVIDTTNPTEYTPGMPPRLFVGHTDSLGEQVQRWLPDARVVKAYNTVGYALMVEPDLPGGPPTMFICGNDADAKKIVSQICDHFGWEVSDLGGIECSRYLEPMCLTWVLHAIRSGSWTHAFKLLKR